MTSIRTIIRSAPVIPARARKGLLFHSVMPRAAAVLMLAASAAVPVTAAQDPPATRSDTSPIPGPYRDVHNGAFYAAAVSKLHAEGVFADTECFTEYNPGLPPEFCPDLPIDRATMAVWTVRIVDGEDPPGVDTTAPRRFDDVGLTTFVTSNGEDSPPAVTTVPRRFDNVGLGLPPEHVRFIERLADLGITQGCGDGSRFCPDQPVTRAQMAVFLTRAFNLPEGPAIGFDDVPADAWYATYVDALHPITRGCGDGSRFCPDNPTSRAEMAVFLHRANELPEPLNAEVSELLL